ncbi:MAG: 2-amino-4-hydroxy-6-hydroxymethyldihydropteridine diphosphokinase [Acidobacteria bacterium]|nr:2-amino-4-hydroxy-6-hydroxymethyldihydropteridine diphosphokinase [Acidobacteriota bacterium]
MPHRIFLSLGSNLGDRAKYLESALALLEARGVRLLRCSSLFETEPIGVKDQPWFLNLVCEVATAKSAAELLDTCQQIEDELGRIRLQPLGPRTIDIDILFFGNLMLETPQLKLPHPRLYERNFVLIPLEQIAPEFRDPRTGRSVRELRLDCGDTAIVRRMV